MLYSAGYTGVMFVLPLYFQRGLGCSALAAGAVGTPFPIGSAVGAAFSGRAVYRRGRLLVVVGALTVALALAGLAVLISHDPGTRMWLVILVPLLIAGAGSGLVIGPNLTLALRDVPPAEGGTAAAVLRTGQRIGSAFGLAVAASLFLGTLTASHGSPSPPGGRCSAPRPWWAWRCSSPSRTVHGREWFRRASRGTVARWAQVQALWRLICLNGLFRLD